MTLLAGCGANTDTPTPNSGATRSTSLPHETATRATVPTAFQPTPVVVTDGDTTTEAGGATTGGTGGENINCGTLEITGNPPHTTDSETLNVASACFLQAVKVCHAATLTFQERETGIVRQFSVEHGDTCAIREALQPSPDAPPASADCESAEVRGDGIAILNCSHFGDFILTL